jgi:hypothetical protein
MHQRNLLWRGARCRPLFDSIDYAPLIAQLGGEVLESDRKQVAFVDRELIVRRLDECLYRRNDVSRKKTSEVLAYTRRGD